MPPRWRDPCFCTVLTAQPRDLQTSENRASRAASLAGARQVDVGAAPGPADLAMWPELTMAQAAQSQTSMRAPHLTCSYTTSWPTHRPGPVLFYVMICIPALGSYKEPGWCLQCWTNLTLQREDQEVPSTHHKLTHHELLAPQQCPQGAEPSSQIPSWQQG